MRIAFKMKPQSESVHIMSSELSGIKLISNLSIKSETITVLVTNQVFLKFFFIEKHIFKNVCVKLF